MKRRGIEPMHDTHVNVTPLIDVVMCLIIFFLVCGRLAREESNDQVVIPRASQGQELGDMREHLVINLVPHDRAAGEVNGGSAPDIVIRNAVVGRENLGAYLQQEKRENPDVKVILRADENIGYGWIAPVLEACAEADIRSVNFSTRKE